MKGSHEIKVYAWMASAGLVCLFIGLFMAIKILALKASEVFEGVVPEPSKLFLFQLISVSFICLSVALGFAVVRGLRNIKAEK